MNRKERLTVTVDRDLVAAGNKALAAGRVGSLSGWVNLALSERVAKEQRLAAMAEALEVYESRFGAITAAEMVAQQRADRRAAVVVRGSAVRKRSARRRARAA